MHSCEEKAAASAVALLGAGNLRPSKMAKTSVVSDEDSVQKEDIKKPVTVRRPHPFYYYKDFSREPDDDPLAPLTPPGRVPNFPAKMHAILSRPDLAEIVSWMPHGRSWRVLKPREFEVRVIPTYFEHSKFSSFIRQANGWGFRRITQGCDRNSYYNELFLRGLPHLCKKMKRPGVAEKAAADPEHEPDFYKISKMFPVPEKAADDESIMLHCTLQGGPKARMPVYSRPIRRSSAAPVKDSSVTVSTIEKALLPSVHQTQRPATGPLHQGQPASTAPLHQAQSVSTGPLHLRKPQEPALPLPQQTPPESYKNLPAVSPVQRQRAASLSLPDHLTTADRLALAMQSPQLSNVVRQAAALEASAASADFAAGFAAAAALNSNHIRNFLGQALAASSSPLLGMPATPHRSQFGLPSNNNLGQLHQLDWGLSEDKQNL